VRRHSQDRQEDHRAGAAAERVERRRNYESVRALVAPEIEETKGKISAKRLLPTARAGGYAGSDRNFRRLVAQERSKYGSARRSVGSPAGGLGRRVSTWSSTGVC
jgi:hypothetical protein